MMDRIRITKKYTPIITRIMIVHQWDGVPQMEYEIVARLSTDDTRITLELPTVHGGVRLYDGETLTINHHTPT